MLQSSPNFDFKTSCQPYLPAKTSTHWYSISQMVRNFNSTWSSPRPIDTLMNSWVLAGLHEVLSSALHWQNGRRMRHSGCSRMVQVSGGVECSWFESEVPWQGSRESVKSRWLEQYSYARGVLNNKDSIMRERRGVAWKLRCGIHQFVIFQCPRNPRNFFSSSSAQFIEAFHAIHRYVTVLVKWFKKWEKKVVLEVQSMGTLRVYCLPNLLLHFNQLNWNKVPEEKFIYVFPGEKQKFIVLSSISIMVKKQRKKRTKAENSLSSPSHESWKTSLFHGFSRKCHMGIRWRKCQLCIGTRVNPLTSLGKLVLRLFVSPVAKRRRSVRAQFQWRNGSIIHLQNCKAIISSFLPSSYPRDHQSIN